MRCRHAAATAAPAGRLRQVPANRLCPSAACRRSSQRLSWIHGGDLVNDPG